MGTQTGGDVVMVKWAKIVNAVDNAKFKLWLAIFKYLEKQDEGHSIKYLLGGIEDLESNTLNLTQN